MKKFSQESITDFFVKLLKVIIRLILRLDESRVLLNLLRRGHLQ